MSPSFKHAMHLISAVRALRAAKGVERVGLSSLTTERGTSHSDSCAPHPSQDGNIKPNVKPGSKEGVHQRKQWHPECIEQACSALRMSSMGHSHEKSLTKWQWNR